MELLLQKLIKLIQELFTNDEYDDHIIYDHHDEFIYEDYE